MTLLRLLSQISSSCVIEASITQLEEIWDSNLNNVIGKFDKEFRDQIKVLPQFLG